VQIALRETAGARLETVASTSVPLIESPRLRRHRGAANPKARPAGSMSTVVIADETRGFDHIAAGYTGRF